MLSAGETFENPRTGARMEVLVSEPDSMVLRRTLKPGHGKIAKHYHLDFLERFTIESGRASARLGREKLELGPGDELAVPMGTHHLNPYNAGEEDVVMVQAFEPANNFTHAFVAKYAELLAADRLTRSAESPLPAVFAIANRLDSQTFASGPPRAFQRRVVAPLGAGVARLRGLG